MSRASTLTVGLLCVLVIGAAADVSKWSCTVVKSLELGRTGSDVFWRQLNCTGSGPGGSHLIRPWTAGPMIFNTVDVNLTSPGVTLQPAAASATAPSQLQTVPEMAANVPNAVAGINGGYFWRLDDKGFIDDVCFGKMRDDAARPTAEGHPNYGVGDCALIAGGKVLSRNCDLPGYARPTSLVINGSASYIVVQDRGASLPDSVQNAIAAGPNLVSFDTKTSSAYVDIPEDDWNVNIWEHSANTAVGLIASSTRNPDNTVSFERAVLVTSNGYDGCKNPDCGLVSLAMAYFGKDYLGLSEMMAMDQGGSTTMWVNGQPNNGVVSLSSNSTTPNPRNIFDSLFVTVSP